MERQPAGRHLDGRRLGLRRRSVRLSRHGGRRATALYDPFATGGALAFPAGFAPDWLVWVQDDATATLLQWNGTSWVVDRVLNAPNFNFDAPHTDLLLPFGWLGLTPSSSLKLLAVASQDDALNLWAAAPNKNPLNDPRRQPGSGGRDLRSYGLTQFAAFPSLGSGVLPNSGRSIRNDLRVSITSTPGGFTAGYLADNLYDVLTPGAPLDANLDSQPDLPLPMAEDPLPVGNGQTISYTIKYENSRQPGRRERPDRGHDARRLARWPTARPARSSIWAMSRPASRPRCRSTRWWTPASTASRLRSTQPSRTTCTDATSTGCGCCTRWTACRPPTC
ncbi:MAG: hypothetical protein H6647_08400 [Anaerolineales bacterium]|nr:hypothetical protein [Anaerolineales bacterium]